MKKILVLMVFCASIMIPLTVYSKNSNEKNTITNVSTKEDAEKNVNNDAKIMTLEYDEYADRFEYNGRKYLYSEMKLIQSQDYTYFVLDGDKKEISITKILNANGEVTIPSELDGYKVVCLGVPLSNFSAYEEGLYKPKSQYSIFDQKDMNNVTSLVIPEGIKHIGITAFMDMGNLKKVSLPDSLETIGIEAFANDGIEELVLPKNLKFLNMCAFYGCESLTKVTVLCSDVRGGGEYPSFKFCPNIELVTWGDVDYADVDLFSLSTIQKVIISSSIKSFNMTGCNIKTLIIEGKKTNFKTNKELGKCYWNDKFSIIIPQDSVAIKTIKGLKVKYKIVTLPKILTINKTKMISNHIQKIKLTWKTQSNITKYQIYYSESRNGEYQLLEETDKRTYTTTERTGYIKICGYQTYQGVNWYGDFKLIKLN